MTTKKSRRRFLSLLLLLLILPFLLYLVGRTAYYFIAALGQPANLVIDTSQSTGPLKRPWQGLAQGGETLPDDYLTPLHTSLSRLSPSYIRLDHLFDRYMEVSLDPSGQVNLDFTRLDNQVDRILSLGALPFFSLSYLPPVLAQDDIVSPPKDWNQLAYIVQKTIEHYSGTFQQGKRLPNLYYEVWNEPDLFGNWKTYGPRNYLTLYRTAARAAAAARVSHPFKLGGPATTGFYPSWAKALLTTATQENLKLDFISYHRYSPSPEDFQKDSQQLESLLVNYPSFRQLPRVISEWGYTGKNHPAYDNLLGAAHTVATARTLLDSTELALAFQIQDGPDPEGQTFWGRWGLFTSPQTGSHPKPRYFALKLLQSLSGNRLPVTGEGTWVKAIGVKNRNQLSLLIVNYDPRATHSEIVPITLTQLPLSHTTLTFQKVNLYGTTVKTENLNVEDGKLTTQIPLSPNEVALLTFTPNP